MAWVNINLLSGHICQSSTAFTGNAHHDSQWMIKTHRHPQKTYKVKIKTEICPKFPARETVSVLYIIVSWLKVFCAYKIQFPALHYLSECWCLQNKIKMQESQQLLVIVFSFFFFAEWIPEQRRELGSPVYPWPHRKTFRWRLPASSRYA